MKTVSVLFARRDSVYKTLPCKPDVFDEDRDARTFKGGTPVIAHPPCRGWGRLRHMSNHSPAELDLARFAVRQVRINGGVLEHPAHSTLWRDQNLPLPGEHDSLGGFTLPVFQSWFGHRAEKSTFLYIVGCKPQYVPSFPLCIRRPTHVVAQNSGMGRELRRPEITKSEREHTPIGFALWLCTLAASTEIVPSARSVA